MAKYTKKWILHRLLDETMTPEELMRVYNIYPHVVPLGGEIAACIYLSRGGYYHIFVSIELSTEMREEVFLHEIYYIIENTPKSGYILELDMTRRPMGK